MEIFSDNYYNIYNDLIEINPTDPIVMPCPYDENLDIFKNVEKMYRYLLRSLRRKDRITALVNAFYLGQVLEYRTQTPAERSLCCQKLTLHYRENCIKIFNIFELMGVEQLYRSQRTKFWMFRKIKEPELQRLIQEATILGLN